MNPRDRGEAIVVTCSCGGWVMVAALGYNDADNFREAGELAAMGYTVRSPVSTEEVRSMRGCKHRGDCLKGLAPDPAQIDALEATP